MLNFEAFVCWSQVTGFLLFFVSFAIDSGFAQKLLISFSLIQFVNIVELKRFYKKATISEATGRD